MSDWPHFTQSKSEVNKMNREIFREYDVRGLVEKDLSNEVTVALGQAMGTYFRGQKCRRIVVGRDCRLSSTRLRKHLTEGLTSTGLELEDIGVCPSPLLYFALQI